MVVARVIPAWRWLLIVVAFATVGVLAAAGPTVAHPFLNSSEPGCDGSDPNVLLCDDFENGVWYPADCDRAGHPSPSNPEPIYGGVSTKGWCGTIYANPITPPNAAVCGGKGAAGSNCAADGGFHDGVSLGGTNMADHALGNFVHVQEAYIRFYRKYDAGYVFGAEKGVTLNRGLPGDGGIDFGNWSINCASSPQAPGVLTMGFLNTSNHPNCDYFPDFYSGPEAYVTAGHWYYYELHFKNSSSPGTPDGIIEWWVNDCGTDGLGCRPPMTPTKVYSMKNIAWNSTVANGLSVIWLEGWANPPSGRGHLYWDELKVSRVGPIGFRPGGTATGTVPAAPGNVTVR